MFVSCVLLLFPCFVCGSLSPEKLQKIDDYIHTLMAQETIPGLAVTVVQNKTDVMAKGYGFADLQTSKHVTEWTLFPIASLTKGITATLVVKYFHDNNLSLDEPLQRIAPDVFILRDRYRTEHVNMRDLLSHRTCISGDNFAGALGGSPTRENFVWRLRFYEEVCPFRTRWVYNNAMYTLAGHILEKLSGVPWETMIQESIFRPLQMNDTMFAEEVVDYFDKMNVSKSYWLKGLNLNLVEPELFRPVKLIAPAAAVVTNAVDMGKWITFHLTHGLGPDGKRIMEKNVLEPLYETNMFIISGTSYTMGFMDIGNVEGQHTLMHDGFYPMYTSLLSLFHESGVGVFTAANGPSIITKKLKELHINILRIISDIPETWNRNPDAVKEVHCDVSLPQPHQRKSCNIDIRWKVVEKNYEGNYGNLLYGNISIYTQAEKMYMSYGMIGLATLQKTRFSNRYSVLWNRALEPLLETATKHFHVEFVSSSNSSTVDLLYLIQETKTPDACIENKRILFHFGLRQEDAPLFPYDTNSC